MFTLLSPLELKKKFSDGSRRFEFEWVISGQGLKIGLALKSRFTTENLRFSKSFQTGQVCLSSRGDNKVNEHGKSGTNMINQSIESCDFLFCHKKNFELDFWKFCGKQTKYIPWIQIYCVFTHTLNFKIWNLVCLFSAKVSKI